jgi:hypothetical protein
MRVKLFWKNEPGRPARFRKLSFRNAKELEDEINVWLAENPTIKVIEVKQSASGGSFAGSLWLLSVWYEEADG